MLSAFLEKLLTFPLWVKQVIYLRLYQNLSQYLSEDFITVNENHIFHLYVPKLTFVGETELFERKCGLDDNIYNFLGNVNAGLSILEISMNNFWTMEEVAKCFMLCIEQDYVKTPEAPNIKAMAGFISGKYRTGEYFKISGRININQLERVVDKQKELAEEGKNVKIAEIMINMGLISQKDTASLMIIKEESQKRFILDASIVPAEVANAGKELKEYQDEIAKLKEQNTLLKTQLAKIVALIKKNA